MGRKLGILLTDGADADIFAALRDAIAAEEAVLEVIAPKISGATLSDGALVPAQQKIDGGPSVLYDAVVLLVSEEGAALLGKDAPTRDFIADAFAHCKFIGYSEAAAPLLEKAGVADALDTGCVALADADAVPNFMALLPNLRQWDRELGVDADA